MILSTASYMFYPWIIVASAFIAALITILWLMRPMITVGNHHPEGDLSETTDGDVPKMSVIVCTGSREEELIAYLDSLSAQTYKNYEIIVVCDATLEGSSMLAERCALQYKNVYVTFIPPGSHNLSRRKLALTLGMKAATGEIVLTTTSNALIPSPSWLSGIMAPFCGERGKDTEIVLGYTHPDFSQMNSAARWYREFDSVMTDSRWLGAALSGEPYRGDGYNLALRRDLFFRNKGYSRTIGLQGGDDDIFINEVCTPENTVTVLSPETILTIEWGDASTRIWKERKEQYDFTSHYLPLKPFSSSGFFSAMQWVVLILCVIGGVSAWFQGYDNNAVDHHLMFDMLAAIPAALGVWGLFVLTEIIIYRRCAAQMEASRLWWALPWFMLWRPLGNLLFRMRHHGSGFTTF